MKKRIWELDALRGLGILGMVIVHLCYDLTELFAVWQMKDPTLFLFVKDWGGILFLVLSGICVTLGAKHIRRGLVVLGCGILVSAVTVGMYLLEAADKDIIIYFGVLHCLGVCMLLWPLFRKCPVWLLAVLGAAMVAGGLYLADCVISGAVYLLPLGVTHPGFASSDYFPLLPNLGYFLLGAVLGKTLYKNRQSLLPGVKAEGPILRFFCWCGRSSLWIYLIHQPVLYGAITLVLQLLQAE